MKRIGLLMLILAIVASHIPSTIASQPTVFREPAPVIPSATTAQFSNISSAASPDNMEQPSVITTASTVITLTINGLQPSVLTTTFGADVMWINSTSITHTLVSGEPYRLYLPLVLRSGGVLQAEDAASLLRDAPLAGSSGLFTAMLPPGGVFTYTFFTSGSVPYFLADAPQLTGRVIVQLDLPPDPIEVAPPLDSTVPTNMDDATRFLYTGSDPIQTGVVSGTIEARRVAVLRGRVLTRENRPLPGVGITVLNHPEYGQTLSRADGVFDLAVNGGGPLTLNYAVIGHLSAQRAIDVPWQDYVTVPDVIMIRQDLNTSLIDLSTNIPMQVARGSVITDTDGVRQQTLFFPQGTTAYMSFANGMTQTITTMHVRATEYTVGSNGEQAMPAELPPNSAYTYASIFHADEAVATGAQDVWFNPPIISYVENFLTFGTGITVPMGYYDTRQGVWVAGDSGRVIKIQGVTNGLADLDLDGSNAPASPAALAALGVTEAERAKLAELYPVGESLWRVPVPHFDSGWDQNQGTSCEEPCPSPEPPEPQKQQTPDPDCQSGSIIECQNQVLGESVNLTGAPFNLHYDSGRVPGYPLPYRLKIPLSGASVSPKLKHIELSVLVAGRLTSLVFPPSPNLSYDFRWDGKDTYGRRVQGATDVTVRLTYAYPLVYQYTDRFGYNGGGAIDIMVSPQRADFSISKVWRGLIGAWLPAAPDLGGWNLSVRHVYDPQHKTLYLGGGGQRNADSLNFDIITTAAGSGQPGYNGDNVPATQAKLYYPTAVAAGPDGSLYIADYSNMRVRRVGPDGIITTIAGDGQQCLGAGTDPCGDGGPATQAQIGGISHLALSADGSLFLADPSLQRVRRVGPDGIITTVAGNGTVGWGGDGSPATQAQMNGPRGIAVGIDRTLYILDGQRLRRVGTDGIISTVAGNGQVGGGYNGDGIPAAQALLQSPNAVAVGPDGSVYIADTSNRRIRRIGPDGIITTIAGNGQPCFSPTDACGDGGLATSAMLYDPLYLAIGPDGSLHIADNQLQRIRRVGLDGIIWTMAGTGLAGESRDGGAAPRTDLNYPQGVAIGPDGALYIADTLNMRIRRVASALPGGTQGDLLVASEDGSQVYVFDPHGRHLRTSQALTGAVLYQFAYDGQGRLSSVTDGDGNITTITRAANGDPTGIVAPFGQVTAFTLDANGYLASIANPASEIVQLGYTADGLLTSYRDPSNNLHTFQYDALGRLVQDNYPASGYKHLSRQESPDVYTVTLTTALGRSDRYRVEFSGSGDERHVNTDSAGLQSESLRRSDATEFTRAADGTTSGVTLDPDPRWGMIAPVPAFVTTTLSGGLTFSAQTAHTATLTDITNPFSLITQTETVSINGRPYTSTYTAATRTWVDQSPMGRTITTTTDVQGRVIYEQAAGLAPSTYAYDSRGRLITATMGMGVDARAATFVYNSAGYLAGITDPLNRTASFDYDLAGRITHQTLPDGRVIDTTYDLNGNLASLAPPGRPAHTFDYTPVDLVSRYAPPDVNPGSDDTLYTYNFDHQPTLVTRPDGQTIGAGYDSAGRLNALTIARGVLGFTYDASSGNLASLNAPGGIALAYTYDGSLVTGTTLSGPIAGTTVYTYDNNLRLTASDVNAAGPIAYLYDDDSLLTQSGALTLNRDLQNSLLTGSMLGSITDTWSYNGFGEPIDFTAGSLFSVQYERDKLGRIVTKTETISGVTDVYIYTYDLVGRLVGVARNGTAISAYTYDSNGNRLTHTHAGGTITGTYDAQDRLLQYGAAAYSYTANGELLNKTSGGQTTNYQYDALGNLITVTLPNNAQIVYLTDGQQRRVGKQVNGVLTQGWLYESQLRPVAELNGAGSIVSRFVYATRVNVPDYMIKGGATYRFILDHLGSPRLIVNAATRQIVQRMDYDEFGRVLLDTNPGFQPFGFAGGLYDHDTGLVRFGARDYDAETSRWRAKDPIGFEGGDSNLFRYVSNDPINNQDSFGLDSGDATVVCNGKGDFKIILGSYAGTPVEPCVIKHEESHIKDYKETYGNDACKGQLEGSQPWKPIVQPSMGKMQSGNEFVRQSECRAYFIGQQCTVDKLKEAINAEDKDLAQYYYEEYLKSYNYRQLNCKNFCGIPGFGGLDSRR